MADHEHQSGNDNVESTDRGFFDFMKKKNEDEKKSQEEVISTEFQQKVEVSKEEDNKHGSLLDKLHHHSDSSDSSSSDEEGDDEEKKRRRKERKEQKKSLKEKLKEKLPGHKDKLDDDKEEDKKKDHHHHEKEDTNVPIEKIHVEEVVYSKPSHPTPVPPAPHHYEAAEGDKKGLLEKIKDKLPGQHKKPEGEHHDVGYVAPTPAPAPAPTATASVTTEVEGQEKKGFLDKIKEKIPGFHPKAPEEEKKDHVDKRDTETTPSA